MRHRGRWDRNPVYAFGGFQLQIDGFDRAAPCTAWNVLVGRPAQLFIDIERIDLILLVQAGFQINVSGKLYKLQVRDLQRLAGSRRFVPDLLCAGQTADQERRASGFQTGTEQSSSIHRARRLRMGTHFLHRVYSCAE
jgi:hypothetical protein